jgi:hypothetical protein
LAGFKVTGKHEIPNHKSQIANKSQLPKSQIPNLRKELSNPLKGVLVIEFWILFVIWCLSFGIYEQGFLAL